MTELGKILVVGFLTLVFIAIGFIDGFYNGYKAMQDESIEAGVAHWSVDSKTGATTFEFTRRDAE